MSVFLKEWFWWWNVQWEKNQSVNKWVNLIFPFYIFFSLQNFEHFDDGQLKALLDEAITYKTPKDREHKSEAFKVSACFS